MKLSGLTTEQINNSHKALVAALQSSDPEVVLEIANAIYYHQGFTVLSDFISVNRNFYNAEVNTLNFANTAEALETINGWVAQKTHDKIPTIIGNLASPDARNVTGKVYARGHINTIIIP